MAERGTPLLRIESIDQEGRGVGHQHGKVVFVEGALTGEHVEFTSYRRKANFELATVGRILQSSAARVLPKCAAFGVCGGCSMQHLDARAQVAVKQRVLEDNLERIGKVRPDQILPAIHGPSWGYRHRARLSARFVQKKNTMLVGFHERKSSFVADMRRCEILPPKISALLVPLRELIGALSIRDRLPQVELAMGDGAVVFCLRVLEPPQSADLERIRHFADAHGVQIFLQPEGPASVARLWPQEAPPLQYHLSEFGLEFPFLPADFTQVNPDINQILVRRAMQLLEPRPGEIVADFFCGLGNFSLAIARSGARVTGVEGNPALARRAMENAKRNALEDHCRFLNQDLFEIQESDWQGLGHFDRILIDPPRDGAVALVKALLNSPPQRIVYVSCNPATLARDAEILVHHGGYRLAAAGVINMFPHTSHVESIALFER
ncbi:MAG: 23S rRNA (uracil(1939)-C(5))-methyltransferase RlmD [Burkholderiales bacterium]